MNQGSGAGSTRVDRWAEALIWYSTLRDADGRDLIEAVGRKWQQWYSDPQNRRVFDDVSHLLGWRDFYSKRARPSEPDLDTDSYDLSVPITEWRRSQSLREVQKRRSSATAWRWLSRGIGAAAMAVLLLLPPPRMWPSSSKTSPVVYQTDIGRLRDIRLSDGSKIILGGLTKISVEFSATQRSVSLVNGQAWFKVAHDQRRSFIVSAGDGTIADVGTAFLVTRDSDRVVVSVTEGTVEVSTRLSVSSRLQMRQTAPIRVRQGEQLVFGDNGALSGAKRTDTHAAMAWTNEQLMFEDQPLRYVIETVNRYSARRILVSPAAGQLRLSGIVFENDIQEWLQTLQAILPVTVQEQGSSLRIQTRDPTTISQPK